MFQITVNNNSGFIRKINEIYISFKKKQEKRRVFNKTVKELSQLSDRELADLGLRRTMIKQVAMEPYYDNH